MLTRTLPTAASTPTRLHPGWSSLLPREHGSWALVLEPLLVALLVAPSWRGGALALAAVALFLMRRPYLVLATEPASARRLVAGRALAVLGVLALALAGLATASGSTDVFAPLVVAAGGAGIFFWFDRQREARAAIAECAGAATYAAVAAGIVVLAGGSDVITTAAAVGGFAVARGWMSILPVRVYVRRRKGQGGSGAAALAVAVVWTVVGVITVSRLGTWVPAAWILIFTLRTLWLVGPWAPSWPARRIGWMEAALGAIACLTTGLSL